MLKPQFSVVIPCYNVAATLAETLASVSAQTCPDFEIIAVDNNSTDRTAEVLAAIAVREPRLRTVGQPVQGLAAARNAGIVASRGCYVAFLDADDLFDPGYLAAHAANFADGSVALSYTRIRLVDLAGRPTGNVTRPPLSGLTAVDLLRSNPVTSMVVARRNVFERAGLFDESLRRMEDQEWLFRVAASDFVFRGIDEVLASYRINPAGLSMDLDAMLRAHAQLIAAADRVAPALVARQGRLSRGSMLRYCARRAVDQGKEPRQARAYLHRMLLTAPDLLLREPWPTLRTAAAVLLPGIVAGLRGKALRDRPAKEA